MTVVSVVPGLALVTVVAAGLWCVCFSIAGACLHDFAIGHSYPCSIAPFPVATATPEQHSLPVSAPLPCHRCVTQGLYTYGFSFVFFFPPLKTFLDTVHVAEKLATFQVRKGLGVHATSVDMQ